MDIWEWEVWVLLMVYAHLCICNYIHAYTHICLYLFSGLIVLVFRVSLTWLFTWYEQWSTKNSIVYSEKDINLRYFMSLFQVLFRVMEYSFIFFSKNGISKIESALSQDNYIHMKVIVINTWGFVIYRLVKTVLQHGSSWPGFHYTNHQGGKVVESSSPSSLVLLRNVYNSRGGFYQGYK